MQRFAHGGEWPALTEGVIDGPRNVQLTHVNLSFIERWYSWFLPGKTAVRHTTMSVALWSSYERLYPVDIIHPPTPPLIFPEI